MVAIIGVLAAVAIPAYNNYTSDAAENTAKISAKTIYKAVQVCLASGADSTDCLDDTVNGTIDKSCAIADGTAVANGQCAIAGTAAKTCVAVGVKDQTYCVDNTTGDNAGDDNCTAGGVCA